MHKSKEKSIKRARKKIEEIYPEAFLLLHNIRNFCRRYGITDKELCVALGTSQSTFIRRKRMPWNFTTAEVSTIAKALHVSVATLYTEPVYPVPKVDYED